MVSGDSAVDGTLRDGGIAGHKKRRFRQNQVHHGSCHAPESRDADQSRSDGSRRPPGSVFRQRRIHRPRNDFVDVEIGEGVRNLAYHRKHHHRRHRRKNTVRPFRRDREGSGICCCGRSRRHRTARNGCAELSEHWLDGRGGFGGGSDRHGLRGKNDWRPQWRRAERRASHHGLKALKQAGINTPGLGLYAPSWFGIPTASDQYLRASTGNVPRKPRCRHADRNSVRPDVGGTAGLARQDRGITVSAAAMQAATAGSLSVPRTV